MCSTGKVATFLLKQNPAPRALVLLAAVSEALLGYVSSRCVWFPPRWDVDHPIIHLLWLESQPGKRRAPCDLESTPKSMRDVESGEICWQVTPARCTRRVLCNPLTHPGFHCSAKGHSWDGWARQPARSCISIETRMGRGRIAVRHAIRKPTECCLINSANRIVLHAAPLNVAPWHGVAAPAYGLFFFKSPWLHLDMPLWSPTSMLNIHIDGSRQTFCARHQLPC